MDREIHQVQTQSESDIQGKPLSNLAQGMTQAEYQKTPPRAVAFDPEEAIARCYESREMLREMIQYFFEQFTNLLPQMRTALEKGDLVEVGHLGHHIKGTLLHLGAQPAKEAALLVERFCKSSGGTPSEAEEAINALEHECLILKTVLSEHPLATESTQKN